MIRGQERNGEFSSTEVGSFQSESGRASTVESLGRRERSKRDKRERILVAARSVFTRVGFESATTLEIAELADISHATLFRYASTKSELMLMVGNERAREALQQAHELRGRGELPTPLMLEIAKTMIEGDRGFANQVDYHRQALAVASGAEHRDEAFGLLDSLIKLLASILVDAWPAGLDPDDPMPAARAAYACFHIALLRNESSVDHPKELLSELSKEFAIIVRGYLPSS